MTKGEAQLRRFYALLASPEGIRGVAEELDPEFELDEYSTGDTSTVYRGREGFYLWGRRAMTTFSEATLTPLAIEEHGDKLLVELRVRGIGAASGAPVDLVVHHVVEFRDDRLYRIRGFLDPVSARTAAGPPRER
jgi:ketosteroid isomerase-like protein